tara:strand:+ start:97 stop:543 length:447 start_codon:yes stop_codon:yes gene_type:complete
MANIDKKDIQNIEQLEKILKSKKLNSVRVKKGNYEIEINTIGEKIIRNDSLQKDNKKIDALDNNQSPKIDPENIITSPMVGVIYLSPDPSKPVFIKEGQHVKQGDTLLLIEAMKTFNEIKAPKSGVIKKIIALNSQPVEFGETLVIFE